MLQIILMGHDLGQDWTADAKVWLAAAETDRARGLWVDPRGGALAFRDWAERWFATRTVRPTTSAGDLGRYANHLAPAFGDVALKDLTPIRIRTFVAELSARRSAGTVRHVHALLSTMLRDAVEEGLLLVNPCRRTVLPRAPRCDAVYLSAGQLQTLLDAVDPFYRCLVLTAAGTRMPWGELTGLRRDRLDLPRRRLHIDQTLVDVHGQLSVGQPKTRGSRRTVRCRSRWSPPWTLIWPPTWLAPRVSWSSPHRTGSRCGAATGTHGPGSRRCGRPLWCRRRGSTIMRHTHVALLMATCPRSTPR